MSGSSNEKISLAAGKYMIRVNARISFTGYDYNDPTHKTGTAVPRDQLMRIIVKDGVTTVKTVETTSGFVKTLTNGSSDGDGRPRYNVRSWQSVSRNSMLCSSPMGR